MRPKRNAQRLTVRAGPGHKYAEEIVADINSASAAGRRSRLACCEGGCSVRVSPS